MSLCKYYKQKKRVSYDSGATWQDVVPAVYQMGELYELDSADCSEGESVIRWVLVPGDFLCEGKNKYEKEIEEYTTDSINWRAVYPTTFRKGRLIESNSSICNNKWEGHYIDNTEYDPIHINLCPKWYRWFDGVGCVYVDPIKIIRCDSSSSTTLTSGETRYSPYSLIYGTIGDCVTNISSYTFNHCSDLTRLNSSVDGVFNIPSGVTNIGNAAFAYCTSLTSITLPDNIPSIGSSTFQGCSGLTSVTVKATTPPTLGNNAFYQTPIASETGYIYVPSASVNAYKSASGWSTYASRIYPIPT